MNEDIKNRPKNHRFLDSLQPIKPRAGVDRLEVFSLNSVKQDLTNWIRTTGNTTEQARKAAASIKNHTQES